MSKAQINTALIAIAAYAAIAFVQRKVMVVPVIGEFLPK